MARYLQGFQDDAMSGICVHHKHKLLLKHYFVKHQEVKNKTGTALRVKT